MLTRKEKSKETVLLLSNLLAKESKKIKETIEALLFIFPPYFLVFKLWKNFCGFWKNLFVAKITFANFSFNFLPGINFRENGRKSRKSRKFLHAKVSALKVVEDGVLEHSTKSCKNVRKMFYTHKRSPESSVFLYSIYISDFKRHTKEASNSISMSAWTRSGAVTLIRL